MKNSVFKLGVYLKMKNLKRNLFVLYHLTELVVLRNKKNWTKSPTSRKLDIYMWNSKGLQAIILIVICCASREFQAENFPRKSSWKWFSIHINFTLNSRESFITDCVHKSLWTMWFMVVWSPSLTYTCLWGRHWIILSTCYVPYV